MLLVARQRAQPTTRLPACSSATIVADDFRRSASTVDEADPSEGEMAYVCGKKGASMRQCEGAHETITCFLVAKSPRLETRCHARMPFATPLVDVWRAQRDGRAIAKRRVAER